MRKVLILSHNPARDFSADSMLAFHLKKRGFMVWLSTFLQNDGLRITTIKPDVVVLPEIRCEYSKMLAEQCRQYGIQVVVKFCEFGITEESLSAIQKDYRDAIFGRFNINDCIDMALAWGPKMGLMMEQYMRIEASKVAVCGGYQFDPYFTPPPPVPRSDKPTVLFAAGFPYADRNPQFAMPEADGESTIHRWFVENDQQKRGHWLDKLPTFIRTYAKRNWEIIIKPHPGERAEPYEAVLKGCLERKECRLDLTRSGFAAIQEADVLIHAGSTMAYEAHLKNIPAINWGNNNQDVVVSNLSPKVESLDDLFHEFHNLTDNCPFETNASEQVLDCLHRDYFGHVDGSGNQRIAEAIATLPQTEATVPDIWQYPKEALYKTPGVYETVEQWQCDGCKNRYFLVDSRREMVKCIFCGIANVRIMIKNT